MNIIDLAQEIHLNPIKVASTNGGEYKSACPNCKAGKDRFCIWPNVGDTGKYWCRKCNCSGDGIQFCRDFLGLSYKEACQKLNIYKTPFPSKKIIYKYPYKDKNTDFIPKKPNEKNQKWKITAKAFVDKCHQNLLNNSKALDLIYTRGIKLDMIKKYQLGWNSSDVFKQKIIWGLTDNNKKKVWLPKGIAIPSFKDNQIIKIKVRRSDWNINDKWPKYIEISGSLQTLSIYGDITKPIIIVESELDAILIQQYATHLICSIALGGVSKKPDFTLHKIILNSSLVLISLDHDEPGKNKYSFWMKNYPNLKPWPSPHAKSIGDAVQFYHLDLVEWIKSGFSNN